MPSRLRPSRPTMVAAPHARAARDDEPTTPGVERRRCRCCSAAIEPDYVEGERFPAEAAAWANGFCRARCSEVHAVAEMKCKTSWWLGG